MTGSNNIFIEEGKYRYRNRGKKRGKRAEVVKKGRRRKER